MRQMSEERMIEGVSIRRVVQKLGTFEPKTPTSSGRGIGRGFTPIHTESSRTFALS